jgi:alpha-L-rhamnosidase
MAFAVMAATVTATAVLTALTSALSHAAPAAQSPVTVSQLTTENARNPLGVGVASPRLGWQLSSPKRAQRQTAYEIIVASSPSVLAQSRGDVWDSGKVTSSQSSNVTYAGPAPVSRTRYYWEVRVWDGQGLPSVWSTPNWWETALLTAADWGSAEWIGPPVTAATRATVFAPLLRKEFTAAGAITRARAYITGLGEYTLDINGRKVGGRLLDPAFTEYEKTVLYATYDVTSDVRSWQNAIAVELAPGFYYYNTPKLLMRLVIDYADGTSTTIVSDNTWQLDRSGPTSFADSGGAGEPVFGGESYDARRFPVGWDKPGFAAAGWVPANVLPAPGGSLVAETQAPVTVAGNVAPVRVTRVRSGSYVVDMGQMITGWARLTAAGHSGQTVSMQYGEKLNADGSVNSVPLPGPRSRFQRDQYTFATSGTQSWEPSFTFKSFRYVELTGLAAAPKAGTVIGRVVHTSVAHTGSFTSSDPLYNQIHQAMQRTILNGLLGYPAIDPANERSGWTGDTQLIAASETDNFGMDAFLAQWLNDIQDSQRANGSISVIDPIRDGCCYLYAPEWAAAYPLVSWDLYVRYGDIGVLGSHYDLLTKYMQWQLGSLKNGISPPGMYGDWSSPRFNAPPEDRRLSATAYVYRATEIMADIAAALGHNADAASYRSTANSIKTRFNALFLNATAGKYRTATDPGYRQASNAIPLDFGLVPNQDRAAVLRSLVHDVNARGGHLNTGILGTPALLDVLTDNGHANLAQQITNQTNFPSWGQWIKAGADTIWEEWGQVVRSRNQPTLGTVDAWLYEDVAGISPDPAHPGYQNSIIKPHPMAAPSSAAASIDTAYGQVKSSWAARAAAFALNVQVPGNATATVGVPLDNCSVVTESGVPAGQAPGVRSLGRTSGYASFSVGSGTYDFKCTK